MKTDEAPRPKKGEEDITDVMTDLLMSYGEKQFNKMGFKPGKVMTFDYEGSKTILEITRVVGGHWFAKHIELHEPNTVASHYGHNVDVTTNPPYCSDCEMPVTQIASLEGRRRYEDRMDKYLPDGTYIGDEEEPEDED